jgi:glutaredoxin
MSIAEQGKPFVKNAFFVITILFLAAYFLVSNYSSEHLSDEPVTLTRAEPPEILMFSTQSCKYCRLARKFFALHKLPYDERDIEASDKDMQVFYLMGGKGTPLIVVNGEVIHGFDEQAIRDAL